MAQLSQDRLVRKEVALGVVREAALLPEDHIGLRLLAPFEDVQSDDVIFDYIEGFGTGLAPARAEDSEAELAMKDESVGTGRASLIDWAIKDHYDPSDVSRFREATLLGQTAGIENFPLTVQSMTNGFEKRLARDTLVRRRKLDNRIEWLIMRALEDGAIAYNDGKIIFNVDFGRPSGQTNASVTPFSSTSSDPIGAFLDVQDDAWELHRIKYGRAICSTKVIRNLMNSDKFVARSGFAAAANPNLDVDANYVLDNWSVDAARRIIERATGISLIPYDSVYRVRDANTGALINKPFLDDTKVIFLPSEQDIAAFDDTIGFGKTLTSPHPEGNWQSGFYEWEKDTGPDPWGQDFGTGIKAFPVFPHLEYTHVLKVLA